MNSCVKKLPVFKTVTMRARASWERSSAIVRSCKKNVEVVVEEDRRVLAPTTYCKQRWWWSTHRII